MLRSWEAPLRALGLPLRGRRRRPKGLALDQRRGPALRRQEQPAPCAAVLCATPAPSSAALQPAHPRPSSSARPPAHPPIFPALQAQAEWAEIQQQFKPPEGFIMKVAGGMFSLSCSNI